MKSSCVELGWILKILKKAKVMNFSSSLNLSSDETLFTLSNLLVEFSTVEFNFKKSIFFGRTWCFKPRYSAFVSLTKRVLSLWFTMQSDDLTMQSDDLPLVKQCPVL